MNRLLMLLFVALVVTAASTGEAQSVRSLIDQDRERFGAPWDYRKLLEIPAVEEELAIQPKQVEKLKQVFENAPSIKKGDDRKAAMQAFESSLQEVLLPKQWKRCVELRLQQAGCAALVRDDITTQLKITEEQLAGLRKLREQAVADAFAAGFRLGFRPDEPSAEELKKNAADRKLRQENYLKKGLAILSEAQRKQFEELRGKLFEFPAEDE